MRISASTGSVLTDPRDRVLAYLMANGPAGIDPAGRNQLTRALRLDADYQLELLLFDLDRRGVVQLDGDLLRLASLQKVANG
jgi:hypothetical protein